MVSATDPRCPECGGPISATAIYCLHCKADLGDRIDDSADVSDADDVPWTVGGEAGSAGRTAEALLAPDGLVDDSLTAVVALVGGAVAGVLASIVLGLATLHWVGVLGAVAVWLGSTVYLARRRTVHAAFRGAAYLVALLLVLVPVTAFSPALEGGDAGGRVVLFVFAAVVLGVPAVVLALFGYAIGRREDGAAE